MTTSVTSAFSVVPTSQTLGLLREAQRRFTPQEVSRVVLAAMDRRGKLTASDIASSYLTGNPLRRRTGSLARSVLGRSEILDGAPAMRVGVLKGSAAIYAGPQEFGTKGLEPDSPYPTIKPRAPRKALAMPVGETLTPAGVDRYGSPLQYPRPLTFIPWKNGKNAVGGLYETKSLEKLRKRASKAGKAATRARKRALRAGVQGPPAPRPKISLREAVLAYVLLRKVDLKARRFLRDGFQRGMPLLLGDVETALLDLLEGKAA